MFKITSGFVFLCLSATSSFAAPPATPTEATCRGLAYGFRLQYAQGGLATKLAEWEQRRMAARPHATETAIVVNTALALLSDEDRSLIQATLEHRFTDQDLVATQIRTRLAPLQRSFEITDAGRAQRRNLEFQTRNEEQEIAAEELSHTKSLGALQATLDLTRMIPLPGVKLPGTSLGVTHLPSSAKPGDCAQLCIANTLCTTFSYERESYACLLLRTSLDDDGTYSGGARISAVGYESGVKLGILAPDAAGQLTADPAILSIFPEAVAAWQTARSVREAELSRHQEALREIRTHRMSFPQIVACVLPIASSQASSHALPAGTGFCAHLPWTTLTERRIVTADALLDAELPSRPTSLEEYLNGHLPLGCARLPESI